MTKIVFQYLIITTILSVFTLFTITDAISAQKTSKYKLLILHTQLLTDDASFIDLIKNTIKKDLSELTIESFNFRDKTIAELDNQIRTEATCVLTIGKPALHAALATRNSTPIFSTLVKKLELDKQIHNYKPFKVNLTGIYEEQSFSRQLLLARALSPESKNLLLILGRNTRYDLPRYQQLIKLTEFDLSYRILNHQTSTQDFLNFYQYKHGILLILNDDEHYSEQSLKLLLLASYEKQIPMIGNTLNHTKLAAIASVYTTKNQLAIETSKQLTTICNPLDNQPLKQAQFAEKYQVRINADIAKYFELNDIHETKIKQIMTKLEHNSPTIKDGPL